MKKFIRIILIILSIALLLSVFASCGDDDSDANGKNDKSNAGENADENAGENADGDGNGNNGGQKPVTVDGYDAKELEHNNFHYLSFYCEDQLILKMHVDSGDTYESLKPFFPTIPKKEGYTESWENISAVYSDDNKNIRINAVYKKQ